MALNRNEIENFLYREARLMDEHQYDEWEALWTDDAIYWVPCGGEDTDPTKDVSIIYDDRARIAGRLVRLKSGAAWAQDPQSRLRRVVSNIEAYEEDDGTITVYSNFVLAEVRRRSVDSWQDMWVGRTTPQTPPRGRHSQDVLQEGRPRQQRHRTAQPLDTCVR